eukprot:TRINITY_DN3130_c0_g1_i1.p1 TRINITY_DN3130_c0_g1~~TRINITY_DN3130_c0_g1_i1.p1  ORF type:complete len:206 (-),score=26.93 TRINITY_DN3130_c0_g1_i1:212-829(-)
MEDFEVNVFINCPFDNDYRQLLLATVFTTKFLGYMPRLALERADSAETRIAKIVELINESKFGIHDLSRMVSVGQDEHYRMNMPFELGIDYGAKVLKGGKWGNKRILILEKEQFRYQKALSDLSGSDIKSHKGEPSTIVKVIRDWFVTMEGMRRVKSGKIIWDKFNEFNAYLYDQAVEIDGHEDIDELEIVEVIHHMDDWFEMQK